MAGVPCLFGAQHIDNRLALCPLHRTADYEKLTAVVKASGIPPAMTPGRASPIQARLNPGDAASPGPPGGAPPYFLTLLASILIEVSSILVVNAVSTANGFSIPR
jgi:hypothetical protein